MGLLDEVFGAVSAQYQQKPSTKTPSRSGLLDEVFGDDDAKIKEPEQPKAEAQPDKNPYELHKQDAEDFVRKNPDLINRLTTSETQDEKKVRLHEGLVGEMARERGEAYKHVDPATGEVKMYQEESPMSPFREVALEAIGRATSEPAKTLGRLTEGGGKVLQGAYLDVVGSPYSQKGSRTENVRAAIAGEEMPLEKQIDESSSEPAQLAYSAEKGIVESIPKLSAFLAGPVAGAAAFGSSSEKGFDPYDAALALVAPELGKFGGTILKKAAQKAGISSYQALNMIDRLGGGTFVASLFSAKPAIEISKMEEGPEKQKAWKEFMAGFFTNAALGMIGKRPPEIAPSIRTKDGKVYSTMYDHDTLKQTAKKNGIDIDGAEEGFFYKGKFLTREQAAKLVPKVKNNVEAGKLHSGDLRAVGLLPELPKPRTIIGGKIKITHRKDGVMDVNMFGKNLEIHSLTPELFKKLGIKGKYSSYNGFYDRNKNIMYLKPRSNPSDPIFTHELVHAMIKHGLLTKDQVSSIVQAYIGRGLPKGSKFKGSAREYILQNYRNEIRSIKDPALRDEYIDEEHLSHILQDFHENGIPDELARTGLRKSITHATDFAKGIWNSFQSFHNAKLYYQKAGQETTGVYAARNLLAGRVRAAEESGLGGRVASKADLTAGEEAGIVPADERRIQYRTEPETAERRQAALTGRSLRAEPSDGPQYLEGISALKRESPFGAAVEVKPAEFYSDPKNALFMGRDGNSGVVVNESGDLVSVFRRQGSEVPIRPLLEEASHRSKTLDAFDVKGFLPTLYSEFGFVPVARVKFNREYAPEGWDYKLLGEPDVVLMVNMGSKSHDYNSVRDGVPVMDYDSATKLQKELVEKQGMTFDNDLNSHDPDKRAQVQSEMRYSKAEEPEAASRRFSMSAENDPSLPTKEDLKFVGGKVGVKSLYEIPYTYKAVVLLTGKIVEKEGSVVIAAKSLAQAKAKSTSKIESKVFKKPKKINLEDEEEDYTEETPEKKEPKFKAIVGSIKAKNPIIKSLFNTTVMSGKKADNNAPKVVANPKNAKAFQIMYDAVDKAVDLARKTKSQGLRSGDWIRAMHRALNGSKAEIPPAPLRLAEWVEDNATFKKFIEDGIAKNPELVKSAIEGLNSLTPIHEISKAGEIHSQHSSLHMFWGLLSRMLDPYNQEAGWARLTSDPKVLNAIEDSVNGKYKLTEEEWKTIVESKLGEFSDIAVGRNAKQNANAFHAMLSKWNGRWSDLTDIINNKNLTGPEMRRQFNLKGFGGAGIKHKVLSFVLLTLARRDMFIGDRWQVVNLWFPHLEKSVAFMRKSGGDGEIFTYDKKGVPEDTTGAYKVIGGMLNKESVAEAAYSLIENGLSKIASESPWLEQMLGRKIEPSDIHWLTWNIIKNEPVGHSSLESTTRAMNEKIYGTPEFAEKFAQYEKRTEKYEKGGFDIFSTKGSERPEFARRETAAGSAGLHTEPTETRIQGEAGLAGESGASAGDVPAQDVIRFSKRALGENHEFANPPTDREAIDALSEDRKPKYGLARNVSNGTPVGLRIDIPAFNRTGKYVISVHEKAAGGAVGTIIGYDNIARVLSPKFFVNEGKAEKIFAGESTKVPIATVEGAFQKYNGLPEDLDSWTPVGFDPKDHSYFYDKASDMPVVSGREAISVGNTVFVKDPVFGDPENYRFAKSEDAEPQWTRLANETVDAERAKRGLKPAMSAAKKSFGRSWTQAMQKIGKNPAEAQDLIKNLKTKMRAITMDEVALLVHEQIRLQNRYSELSHEINKSFGVAGKESVVAENKAEHAILSDKLLEVYNIGKKAGTETSRGLNARRYFVDDTFSLPEMETEARVARGGRPLEKWEKDELVKAHNEIKDLQREYDEYIAEAEDRISKLEAEKAIKKTKSEKISTVNPKVLEEAEKILKKTWDADSMAAEKELEDLGFRFSKTEENLEEIRFSKADISDPKVMDAVSRIGSGFIARFGQDKKVWDEKMVEKFGENVRQHLGAIYPVSVQDFEKKLKSIGTVATPVRRQIAKMDVGEKKKYATDKIKAKLEAGENENVTPNVRKLVDAFLEEGVRGVDNIITAVHEVLLKIDPEITRREAMDAISGYGKFKPLSKDEISVLRRDYSGQMQQMAKLEDMAAGMAPKATGVARRVPSNEERGLIKQVNEAKKKGGYKVTNPETQLKTVLSSMKRRLENEIADLQKQIDTKSKIVKTKTPAPTDPEIQKLKAERDKLRSQYDLIFPKDRTLTDEQRLSAAVNSARKSAEEYERRVRERDFSEQAKGKPVTSPALEAEKARRKIARDEFERLRELDAHYKAAKEGDQIAKAILDVSESIDDLARRINEGDLAAKSRGAGPTSPVLDALRAEKRDLAKIMIQLRNAAKPKKTKFEIALDASKRLIKKQIENLDRQISSKTKDVKAVKNVATDAELDLLKLKRDDLRKQFEEVFGKPEMTNEQRLKAWKTRTQKQIDKLDSKIAAGDFTTDKPRSPIKLDVEGDRKKAALDRVKQQWKIGQVREKLKNRTTLEKAADSFVKWRRAFVLSGPVTLAKLTAAAAQRIAFTPVEEAIGGVYSKLLPSIAEKAKVEGGFSLKAEAKALSEGVTTGMKDAWDVLRTGSSNLDVLFGKNYGIPRDAIDFIGSVHGALKAPVKRAAYARALEKLIQSDLADGIDPTNPLVMAKNQLLAYKQAQKSIFMQDNRFVSMYKRGLTALDEKNKATGRPSLFAKSVATGIRTLLPVVKIPTNIVAETAQYVFGTATGSARLGRAFYNGIENLSNEEADIIMRSLKKGSIGTAALLVGYFSADVVGGYWQEGEKRKKGDVSPMSMRMLGVDIPSFLLHNPLLEVMQIGATIRRVSDSKLRKKDLEAQGITNGTMAALLGLIEEVPMIKEQLEISKLFNPHEREGFLGEQAKSFLVPQGVQWAAQLSDDGTKRAPETIWEHIETGIPYLREDVKKKKGP
jgi:hypothetical protein